MNGRIFERARAHGFFLATFGAMFLAFFYPFWGFRQGPVRGDYALQLYPWLSAYADALRAGYFLLWTPLVQSGFALFAEGQTGMLYLPNVLFFRFLEFRAAYDLVFILHYLAGGFFAYAFALKKGLSREAATLVSLVFVFGSASAGGFLNLVSLRTLAWFPLALFLTELFVESGKTFPLFLLAIVLGESWLGGSTQMAGYQCVFLVLYLWLRLNEDHDPSAVGKKSLALKYFGMVALSLVIAAPQVWATFESAAHSTRVLQEKAFALWGAAAPWSAASLLFHGWTPISGANFYVSLAPLFFILAVPRRVYGRRLWAWLGLFSFVMALGALNPLSWILVKLPFVSLLRNPAKFLFFAAFALAMIAAFSFDAFFDEKAIGDPGRRAILLRRMLVAGILFWGIALAAWALARFGGEWLKAYGDWYVRDFVLGKSFHRHPPEEYLARLDAMLDLSHRLTSPRNFFFVWPLAQAAVWVFFFRTAFSRNWRPAVLKTFTIAFLCVDLFVYGKFGQGTSFLGNVGSFDELKPSVHHETDGKWLDISKKTIAALSPNRNMIEGVPTAGVYAPLVDKDYYLLTAPFGALDDSMGRPPFEEGAVQRRRPLLDFLGVKYLVADEAPDGFSFLRREGRLSIYENPSALSEFSFTAKDGYSSVRVLEESPVTALLKVDASSDGSLVRNQVFDRGWKVTLDGKQAPLERAERAFQAVRLSKGGHEVRFEFRPDYFVVGRWLHVAGALAALAGLLASARSFFDRKAPA